METTLVKHLEALKAETIQVLLENLKQYGKPITSKDNFEFCGSPAWNELLITTILVDGSYIAEGESEYWSLEDQINDGYLPINDAVYFAEELFQANQTIKS